MWLFLIFYWHSIVRYSKSYNVQNETDVITKAFQFWGNNSNITFISAGPDTKDHDITIQFLPTLHKDTLNFDGEGMIV